MHGTGMETDGARERERCAMTRHAAFPCTTYDRFSMASCTFLSNPSTRETTIAIHPVGQLKSSPVFQCSTNPSVQGLIKGASNPFPD